MATKLETLLEFDTAVLDDVGIYDKDGGGMLSYGPDDKPKAVTIGGKRLVLPTQAFLRDGDWSKRIAWHPLSEQINEGPSPVLNATKGYITIRAQETFKAIALALMDLAKEPKRHKGLPTKSAKFLKSLIDADQKTYDTLVKVFEQVSDAVETRSVSLFLKNGSKTGALRSCNVSFPILDDVDTEDNKTFFGVKMPRIKDKGLILSLLEYILGDKDMRETYTKASNNPDAPYLHSLLLSFDALAQRFNHLIDLHSGACPQLVPFKFSLAWNEQLNNFDTFAHNFGVAVPSLPGNSGVEEPSDEPKKSAFESDEEDVGLVKADLDLPWEERPNDTGRRESRDRRDTPERSYERPASGAPATRSLKDVLGGKSRREEEDTRSSSWRSSSRDTGRDSGRGRDRGGRGW